jgi:hypothetical protein
MSRSAAVADARPAAPASVDLEACVACPRCGVAAVWGALVRLDVLDGPALESHLAVPPDGWFVDVRACSGCGRSLARKVLATKGRVEAERRSKPEQESWRPPVRAAEEPHRGGYEEDTDERRVDRDGQSHPESDRAHEHDAR